MLRKVKTIGIIHGEVNNSYGIIDKIWDDECEKYIPDKRYVLEIIIEKNEKGEWIVASVHVSYLNAEELKKAEGVINKNLIGIVVGDKIVKNMVRSDKVSYRLWDERGKLVDRNEIIQEYIEYLENKVERVVDLVSEMV